MLGDLSPLSPEAKEWAEFAAQSGWIFVHVREDLADIMESFGDIPFTNSEQAR